MKRITKILMIAMLIGVTFGGGWKNIYGGTPLVSIDNSYRFVSWDETADDGGYVTYTTLYQKMFADIKADTLVTDTARIKNLQSEVIHLDITYSDDPADEKAGTLTWNSEEEALNITTGLGNVLQVGQELTLHGKNGDTLDLTNGMVVYLSGVSGGRGLLKQAIADSAAQATRLAVVTIPTATVNSDCPVTTFGKVRDLNTSKWAAGTLLYLSADTAGVLTSTPPVFPNFRVLIGVVLRSHANDGILLISPQLDYTDGVTLVDLCVRDTLRVASNSITEISQDGTMAGNSDYALITEKSLVTYVAAQITATPHYGEMATIDNTTATTINDQSVWHSVYNDVVTGEVSGFTYSAGSNGVISAIADAGSGDIYVLDAGHGLSAGEMITMNGLTDGNYEGVFEVQAITHVDTFTVTAIWGATDTGYWQRGASLTCDVGSAGLYQGNWASSGISETNAHVFDFAPCLNTTVAGKAKSRRKFSNADYGSFSGTALMNPWQGPVPIGISTRQIWPMTSIRTVFGQMTVQGMRT